MANMFRQPSMRKFSTPASAPGGAQEESLDRFAAATEPAYKESRRNVRSELASRGLGGSPAGVPAILGLEQDRQAELGAYAGQLEDRQAQIDEADRVRQILRQYQLEDQETAKAERANAAATAERMQQAGLWGDILASATSMVGGPLFRGIFGRGSQVPELPQYEDIQLPDEIPPLPAY